jgi:cysteine-rich repeat protein
MNGDGDEDDRIVQERPAAGGAVVNHELAAGELVVSEVALAALVSEADQANQVLNGDGDASDLVLAVHTGGTGWTSTGVAGDSLAIAGTLVAFSTPEANQGQDLNADGDLDDRVLHVADAASGAVASTGQSVAEFVAADGFVAFRTRECDEGGAVTAGCPAGGTDRNGDGDAADAVMQVWVSTGAATGFLHDTGLAAVTCDFEACDPRFPYRAAGVTVTFLTIECQQGGSVTAECPGGGSDLNGDGDAGDVVLQVLNVERIEPPAQSAAATPVQVVASVEGGLCTSTGAPCNFDAECGAGTCFVPPGECLLDLGTPCSPSAAEACPEGQVCRALPLAPGLGSCHEMQGACKSTAECTVPAACEEAGQQIQRLVAPVASAALAAVEAGASSGAQVFATTGTCVETLATSCSTSAQCEPGEVCDAGACTRAHGACETDADCTAGSCTQDLLVTATAADADGDGLADPLDVCPGVPDPAQLDADDDGIGDGCDAATCSNTALEPGEECDDGNLEPGDGCDAACQKEIPDCSDLVDDDGDGLVDLADPGCGSVAAGTKEDPACNNSADDDGDGLIDAADPGCGSGAAGDDESALPACQNGLDDDGDGAADHPADAGCVSGTDASEQTAAKQCDDGLDNDDDGKVDYRVAAGTGDPGCQSATSTLEEPQCQDGRNNDNQAGIDFDGGASLDLDPVDGLIDVEFNPATPAVGAWDPQCVGKPWLNKEKAGGCGLGFEIALALPLLAGLRRTRRGAK